MNGIHKSIDCVVFNKNLVNVKLNLDHLDTFTVRSQKPTNLDSLPNDNESLFNMILKEDDELVITGDNRRVLISFENRRTNQHKMSM